MLPSFSPVQHQQPEKAQNILKPYSRTAAKEARRSRGEIACAECRRLKVRCNRQIPCATCVTRGCAALCPNGTLPPGDNSRFVSQATDHLQHQICKMAERMRALEDALAIAQAAQSSQIHPLLTAEAKQDSDTEVDVGATQEEEDSAASDAIVESFGTLHIDEKARTIRFFGTSGGSESLLINERSNQNAPVSGAHQDVGPIDLRALGLPEELDGYFLSFPLPPVTTSSVPIRQIIETFLPPWDRAEALGRIMLDSMSWMFCIVTLRQYKEALMPYVYFNKGGPGDGDDNSPYTGSHGLALFLTVLAVGSLMDVSLPPYNSDSQRYYALAIVALGLEPVVHHHSLSTVKVLHLLSIYCGMSGTESNMANQFALLNFASSLAHRIGLHVDPTHWKMSDEDVYDRRCCYWNLLQGNLWQSIYSGRPSALVSPQGDCKIPSRADEDRFQQGEYALGFGIWGSQYSEECLIPTMKLLVAPKQPTYQAVLELDQKVRLCNPPGCELILDSPSTAESMRWFARSHYKELIILALHRGFFAQALVLNTSNPLDTPYKYSFLRAYEAACAVLDATSQSYARRPQLLSRIWMIWTFGFSSAVIVGAVASRCRNLDIQPAPLRSLQHACTLFERASATNSRAAAALPVLLNMREKAMHLHENPSSLSVPTSSLSRKGSWSADEVDILRGKPRLVESPSNSATATPDSIQPAVPDYVRSSCPPLVPAIPSLPSRSSDSFSSDEHLPSEHLHALWYDITQPYSDRYYGAPPPSLSYPTQPLPEPPRPMISIPPPVQHNAWHPPPISTTATYYQHSPHPSVAPSPAVDFNLEETWTNFLQQYGRLP